MRHDPVRVKCIFQGVDGINFMHFGPWILLLAFLPPYPLAPFPTDSISVTGPWFYFLCCVEAHGEVARIYQPWEQSLYVG